MADTFHSEHHDVPLHLGRTAATPPQFTLWADVRPALARAGLLPKIPKVWGHGNDFGYGKWLMLGNGPDHSVFPGFGGCGDCEFATQAHRLMGSARNAGRPIPPFSGKTVVAQYSAYSGYDSRTGANDNGSNMQEVTQLCQTDGFYDDNGKVYRAGPAISVAPGNPQELFEVAYFNDEIDIGVNLQQAQEDQFNAALSSGAPIIWDYVAGSPTIGGHAIPLVGPAIISWAYRVGVTVSFLENCVEEAHAVSDMEDYNAVTGANAEHLSQTDVEKYFTMVAQAKAAVR